MKNTQKGFTLIELLVVIAIIGILSSIVIASLNSARTKGAVSAAKGQLAQLRTQAETYYDTNNGYALASTTAGLNANASPCAIAGTMFADPVIVQQVAQIKANLTGEVTCAISTDKQKWSVSGTLKSNTSYCVDNSGTSKEVSTSTAAGTCS